MPENTKIKKVQRQHDKVIFEFEFFEDSNSIGVSDQFGFLGSVLTTSTLWDLIKNESIGGRGYTRLLMENAVGPDAILGPDWKIIEEQWKILDKQAAERRRLQKNLKNITVDDLDLEF